MNQMSAQDAVFLHVENDVTPMHIGGVSIFEGPPPAFADLTAMVAGKLDHTPRYRQKVRVADVDVLTTGIEIGAARLAACAEPPTPPRPTRGSRARSRA